MSSIPHNNDLQRNVDDHHREQRFLRSFTTDLPRFRAQLKTAGAAYATDPPVPLSSTGLLKVPPLTWVVEGILPHRGYSLLYGPPNVGKSFLALDLAFAVARGTDFLGHKTTPGHVLYVVAEGVSGFPGRVRAYVTAHDPKTVGNPPVYFFPEAIQLNKDWGGGRLLAAVNALHDIPVLVILDTLHALSLEADENSSKDMGAVISAISPLCQEAGAAVVIVHHTRKGDNVYRGHSSLLGDAATAIEVKSKDGIIGLHCEKQKDAAPFDTLGARLEEIALSNGESSCVVREAPPPPPASSSPGRGHAPRSENTLIRHLLAAHPRGLTDTEVATITSLPLTRCQKALSYLKNKHEVVKCGNHWFTGSVQS